jgi:predicted lipid-binding transport protein (Tim44 family)
MICYILLIGTGIRFCSRIFTMASVFIFILGALFSLSLVVVVVTLMTAPVAAMGQAVAAGASAPRRAPRAAAGPRAKAKPAEPRIAIAQRTTLSDREAYRIAHGLDQAERALSKIARSHEAAAAKIAQQTLRRLQDATEPPQARLSFARSRLELLSLRPEPMARAEAYAAMAAIL